jgi:hypothetical protein
MPKITRGGVSNRLVDPDFIAEPGTPVEVAVDEGRPDVSDTRDKEIETHQGRALYAEDDETTDNGQDKPIDGRDPDPRAGTGQGATVGQPKPNVDSTEGPDVKDEKQDSAPAKKAQPKKAAPPK